MSALADALHHLKLRAQQGFADAVYFKDPAADDNESAVYAPRDAWAPCFCPRCNVKSRPLAVHFGTVELATGKFTPGAA